MIENNMALKKKILDKYCHAKPTSIVAEIKTKLGDDLIIALLNDFSGRLIYLPNKSSLKRVALPMLIQAELRGFVPGTAEFKMKVKVLSEVYKLTHKAIKKINKKGIFSR